MANNPHPPFSLRSLWHCVRNAVVNTIYHDGIEHAGYLAFLGLLAIFPFLVFLFAVAGLLGQGTNGAAFVTTLLHQLPANATAAIVPRIQEIVSGPPQGLLTASILGAIWTASSAVEALRTVLNRAYAVTTPPAYIWRRTLSILQLLFLAFIVITGMLFLVFIPLMLQHIGDLFGIHPLAAHTNRWNNSVFPATILMLFLAVSYLYYLIPNIKQRLISVAPGALIVVLLWQGAAHIFTLYLSNFNQVNLIYGSLGGIIAALVFFYICNIIFIFGAELNHQLVHALGLHMVQKDGQATLDDMA